MRVVQFRWYLLRNILAEYEKQLDSLKRVEAKSTVE